MNLSRVTIIALLALVPPQQRQQDLVRLEGTVVRLGTDDPLPGAQVQLAGLVDGAVAPTPIVSVSTSDDGRFSFAGLAPGERTLRITRPGYMPHTLSITVKTGMAELQAGMTQLGVIYGRVHDAGGEGVGAIIVRALKPFVANRLDGWPRMEVAQEAVTNDLGEYRLFDVPPGLYYISAVAHDPRSAPARGPVESGQDGIYRVLDRSAMDRGSFESLAPPPTDAFGTQVILPVYFPGTTHMGEASRVDLRAGGAAPGTDINIASALATARRVRGRVIHPSPGNVGISGTVRLVAREPGLVMSTTAEFSVDKSNGTFEIRGVVPGSYFLIARSITAVSMAPGQTRETFGQPADGRVPVEVRDSDIEDLQVALTRGVAAMGRFILEPDSLPALPQPVSVYLEPNPSVPQASLSPALPASWDGRGFTTGRMASGGFRFSSVPEGDYWLRVSSLGTELDLGEAYVKSIRLGGMDVLNGGLHVDSQLAGEIEIVVSMEGGIVTGRALNAKSEPVARVPVVLIPEPPLRRRPELYKAVTTNASGEFRLPGIAPGEYKLFAWQDAEPGAWRDPEFLRLQEARGITVRVTGKTTHRMDVTVIRTIQ